MLLLAVAVLAGLAAGWLRPPLGARSHRPHLRRSPLLVVGAVGMGAAQFARADLAPLAAGLSLAVLLGFAISNAHITGVVVIGFGLLLNLVALVVNNGIPVRGDALVTAKVVNRADLATVHLTGARHLETPDDRLAILGDVLPLRAGHEVLSFGDIIVVVGAADAMREVMRRRRRSWSAADRVDYTSAMTQLKAVHDWGTAPSAAPDAGSQYSANPDLRAPATIDLTSPSPTSDSRRLVAATHNK